VNCATGRSGGIHPVRELPGEGMGEARVREARVRKARVREARVRKGEGYWVILTLYSGSPEIRITLSCIRNSVC
jgi:hypothetical protein